MPRQPDTDQMLSIPQLAERYGVSTMSIYRWMKDPQLAFPKPDAAIKNRQYWSEQRTLVPWERASVARRSRGSAAA